jgi:hypothetical protein
MNDRKFQKSRWFHGVIEFHADIFQVHFYTVLACILFFLQNKSSHEVVDRSVTLPNIVAQQAKAYRLSALSVGGVSAD